MSKRRRTFKCANDPDNFCYICGKYIIAKNRRTFNKLIEENYLQYFGIRVENLNEPWTPGILCRLCYDNLARWGSGSIR